MHEPQLHLAEPAPTELGRKVGGPQPLLPHLLLEGADDPQERGVVEVERLQGEDLVADEGPHPFELGLELGLGREVPRHGASSVFSAPAPEPRCAARRPCGLCQPIDGMASHAPTALAARVVARLALLAAAGLAACGLTACGSSGSSSGSGPRPRPGVSVTSPAFHTLQPHRSRVTTYASSVVMTIVVVTAMPYAAARLVDERNPSTSPTVAIINIQLISGMYT